MDCPLKMAGALTTGDLGKLNDLREMSLLKCDAACAWWVGAGKGGNSGGAIAFLGNEAALQSYIRQGVL